MSETPEPTPGRRSAARSLSRRLGPIELVAIVVPLLTVAALALVRPVDDATTVHPPTDVALERTTLVCPTALAGAKTVSLADADGASGDVTTRLPDEDTIALDGTKRVGKSAAVAVQATEDLASGLLGTRYGDGVATSCRAPQPDQWFTGVGAAPEHSSTLEVTNPDGGPAVADVTVLGPDGPVDVPALRGVTVPGGRTLRFDLAEVVPTRDELALQVHVSRGRLGVDVVDQVDELGRGARSEDWLPSQAEAGTAAYLLGLGGKPGDRTLVLANPGDSEARVQVKVVTKESEFALADAEEVRVSPGSTEAVDLTDLLEGRAGRGVIGLRLDATLPVTATLRTLAGGDLSHAVAGAPLASRTALALPGGPSRLLIAGADNAGVATYVVTDAQGDQVADERVELTPGEAARIKLPSKGAVLDLTIQRTGAVASVEVGPPGLAVLPLSELVVDGRVPDVRPALR
ncbi:DUF5719 family protein [Nocardioides currus]|uniref:Secreted protein n=1 Tax=Nocardioides currus TaxID=2133958 RepID=A0A2R7Z070_9ACTN|nr:DUF5719 family protein [Nocardioides currus]PUA81954.1 hypothetical protein C7S10_07910 [Nocardioides currus]